MSMTMDVTPEAHAAESLVGRWDELKRSDPKLRIRDAATALGVAEGQLLATRCGDSVTRLLPDWAALFAELPGLGRVMALTRNEWAVHERRGAYQPATIQGGMGLVLGDEIDLRLFLWRWRHLFAERSVVGGHQRRSLQAFDASGRAIHKIHLTADSNVGHFDRLVERLTARDQSPAMAIERASAPDPERPDSEIDVAALRAGWAALRDVHDFHPLLRNLRVGRSQALRVVGDEWARRVPTSVGCTLLANAAAIGQPIMVFVGNEGCIQIHTGPIVTTRPVDSWFNVLDPDFNLHLRQSGIASVWVVRKPTNDGIITSVELLDREGGTIAMLFGKRKPGQPESETWRRLVDTTVAKSLDEGRKP